MMQDRETTKWRIVYDGSWGSSFPYIVQYCHDSRGWVRWDSCETMWGARRTLRKAKRISKPIGGVMVLYETTSELRASAK